MAALEIPQAVAAFRPVLQLVQAGLFLSLLLAVSVFDLKLRLIPDRLNRFPISLCCWPAGTGMAWAVAM